MTEEDELKESVKEPVKNVVRETVSEVVRRLTKASTKKAIMELKKKLKEKATRRLEGRLKDITEKQLEKQLKESIKQVTKEIVKDNADQVDFIKRIERGFEKGFNKCLSSLSKGLLKPIVITCVCVLVVGGGVYVWINPPTPPPAVPGCITPAHGATDVPPDVVFSWTPVPGATAYEFILAKDIAWTDIVVEETLSTTTYYSPVTLEYGTTYYWHVRGITATGEIPWLTWSFHTMEKPVPTPPLIE